MYRIKTDKMSEQIPKNIIITALKFRQENAKEASFYVRISYL